MPDTRKETDALGVVDVPQRAYYGAFTACFHSKTTGTNSGYVVGPFCKPVQA